MAAVAGARSALPGYFSGAETRANPVVASFEKELSYFVKLVNRVDRKTDFKQKV